MHWQEVSERVARPLGVDSISQSSVKRGVTHGNEPVLVQALVPESPVKAFDVGVLSRLARPHEGQRNAPLREPMQSASYRRTSDRYPPRWIRASRASRVTLQAPA
ncbi:hypothetical protein BURKHO8Y_580063 [Burkholderia sp. 8Y]|nr:hypothetical protein BURKHO8Y_580063 [Burkholderia sp. 8Y]